MIYNSRNILGMPLWTWDSHQKNGNVAQISHPKAIQLRKDQSAAGV